MSDKSTQAQQVNSHKFRCWILCAKDLTTERQRFCITCNCDIERFLRFFAITFLIFLSRFSSISFRDCFSSFSISSNHLRVCSMKSSRSSSMFFHKELWSSSTIVTSWMSYCASRTVWCTSCAILYKEIKLMYNINNIHRLFAKKDTIHSKR
jgi:hypothetical protein